MNYCEGQKIMVRVLDVSVPEFVVSLFINKHNFLQERSQMSRAETVYAQISGFLRTRQAVYVLSYNMGVTFGV